MKTTWGARVLNRLRHQDFMADARKIRELYNRLDGLLVGALHYPGPSGRVSPTVITEYNELSAEAHEVLGVRTGVFGNGAVAVSDFYPAATSLLNLLKTRLEKEPGKQGILDLASLAAFPKDYFDVIREAQECYKLGFYRACCTLCGVVCNNLLTAKVPGGKTTTMAERRAEFAARYGLKRDAKLLEQLHDWRNDSAHLNETEFTEEKAAISLKAIKLAVQASLKN